MYTAREETRENQAQASTRRSALQELKARQRIVSSSGDYGLISATIQSSANNYEDRRLARRPTRARRRSWQRQRQPGRGAALVH